MLEVIPVGVKGTYYFDQLLGAGSKWDFYLSGSLGFAIVRSTWDDGYYGDRKYYKSKLYWSPTTITGQMEKAQKARKTFNIKYALMRTAFIT